MSDQEKKEAVEVEIPCQVTFTDDGELVLRCRPPVGERIGEAPVEEAVGPTTD
ncbi:MAG: hypothetical protein M0Z41_13305 [Peptococcaceae bacterium]|nr:hypothetical protein [Peptococcaceae bacterium]